MRGFFEAGRFVCGAVLLAALGVAGCSSEHTEGGGLSILRSALTLEVPGDYPTIQEALDAAAMGDIVSVAPGHYTENLDVPLEVHLMGAGADQTVLHGGIEYHYGVGGEQDGLTVSGFHITGVGLIDAPHAGIYVHADRAAITDNIIEGFNRGMRLGPGWHGEVRRNLVTRNVRGIALEETVLTTVIESNVISFNTQSGIYIYTESNPSIHHNTFVGNGFGSDSRPPPGGGLVTYMGAEDNTANNIFVSNNAGINRQYPAVGQYKHNLVWGNTINYAGAAVPAMADVWVDPLFVSAASGDFRLTVGSPAIDAGSRVLPNSVDFGGTSRPQGTAPDLGAFETLLPASSVGLIVTEVMANPVDEDRGEFVEVYNRGSSDYDLVGAWITDGDVFDVVVAYAGGTTIVAPGSYAVIIDSEYTGVYGIPAGTTVVTLGNSSIGNGLSTSDVLSLMEADRITRLDGFAHPFNPGNGVSAERVNLAGLDVPTNWRASPCTQSAGRPNCATMTLASGLIITEVMSNPIDEGTGEFIELFNGTDLPIDASGLSIADGDATDLIVGWQGGSTTIAARSYAVILDPDRPAGQMAFVDPTAVLLSVSDSALGNGLAVSDPITLLNASGVVQDSYTRLLAVSNGHSVEKISLSIGDLPGNWAQSSCGTGSSPGYLNCVSGASNGPRKPLSITEVMANPLAEDSGEFIELYNKGIDPIDAAGLLLSDGDAIDVLGPYQNGSTVIPAGGYAVILDAEYADEYPIPPAAVLLSTPDTTIGSSLSIADEIRLLEANGVQVIDSFRFPFNPGNGISAERIDVRAFDSAANWTASSCASGSSPGLNNCSASAAGLPKQLVFTEVMSNQAGTEAGGAGEYVELFNLGDRSVDLRGMFLAAGPPGSELRDQLLPFGGGDTTMLPGTYAVIVDVDYDGRYSFGAGTTIVTIDDGNFGASGLATTHSLTLYDIDGLTPVARFAYPTDPGDGVSLYRISTTVLDSASNWAATPCGTTEGFGSCPGGGDVTSTTSFWLDKYMSEGGIWWYQAIGWPTWYDPICEFLIVCPGSPAGFTYRDNLLATTAFTFENPYLDYAVRFTERSGPADVCTEPCTNATVVVPPGATQQVPASSGGYYFAIIEGPTLNNLDWFGGDAGLYWQPPPDGTLGLFTVETP